MILYKQFLTMLQAWNLPPSERARRPWPVLVSVLGADSVLVLGRWFGGSVVRRHPDESTNQREMCRDRGRHG